MHRFKCLIHSYTRHWHWHWRIHMQQSNVIPIVWVERVSEWDWCYAANDDGKVLCVYRIFFDSSYANMRIETDIRTDEHTYTCIYMRYKYTDSTLFWPSDFIIPVCVHCTLHMHAIRFGCIEVVCFGCEIIWQSTNTRWHRKFTFQTLSSNQSWFWILTFAVWKFSIEEDKLLNLVSKKNIRKSVEYCNWNKQNPKRFIVLFGKRFVRFVF